MLIGKRLFGIEIKRRHLGALAALVGILVLGLAWTLLPGVGLRWGLVKVLRDIGMAEVSVTDADLSLFGGRLVVRQMVARPPSGAAFGLRDFALRFRWAPLLNRRVVVDRIALTGVEVDIRRDKGAQSFVINGLPLAVAAAAPAQPTPDTAPQWGIDVAELDLADSRLVLADGDASAEIAVRHLVIENLHSRTPLVPVRFRLEGAIDGADIALAGTVTPFAARPGFTLDADLKRFDLAKAGPALTASGLKGLHGIADLELSLTGEMAEHGLAIKGSGKTVLDDLALAAPAALAAKRLSLDLKRLDWDGRRLDLALALDSAAVAAQTGDAQIKAATLALDVAALTWDGARTSWQGNLALTESSFVSAAAHAAAARVTLEARPLAWDGALSWQGGLGLAGATLKAAGGDARLDTLNWAGTLGLDPAATPLGGTAEGRLELGALTAAFGGWALVDRHLVTEGRIAFGGAGPAPITGGLKLTTEGLSLGEPAKALDWLALDRFEVTDLAAAADGVVAANRIAAEGLSALRRGGKAGYPWRIEARALRLERPERDGDGDLSAQLARIDGLMARLTRDGDGWVGLPTGGKAGADKPGKPPGVELGRLVVAGNSRVVFEDRTLAETVHLDIHPLDLSLADLDSDEPDRDSAFELKAEIGEAAIALTGGLRPFAEPFGGRIEGRVTALELPPLSPYLAQTLGVQLRTGHFDATVKGAAVKGALDARLDLALSNLFIAPPDPNAPVAKKADMPIATVLDLLRDTDGRIALALPVRGNLANPDFDISDAVAQAVAGALRSTVLTTLKVAFPVAGLISLVMDDDQQHLSLAPLAFGPGDDALEAPHRKTLSEVADLMKGRPGLSLTLCGKATPSDWPVLAQRRRAEDKPLLSRLEHLVGLQKTAEEFGPPDRDALIQLAERRAGAAKAFLVDESGIDSGRLFECLAEVETATKGPRVDLLL